VQQTNSEADTCKYHKITKIGKITKQDCYDY